MKASVVIPTKNGGPLFRRVLSEVLAQKTPWPFEVLVIDSGSRDDTLSLCREQNVRLIEIAPEAFGHGRTRNQAIEACRGEFIAMITQDALPASSHWLANLVAAVEQDDEIAGAFGPHLPYPDCDPYTARDLEAHFEGLSRDGNVVRLDDRERYERDVGYRQRLHFFSDNNACLRRSVWEKIPYPDVDFAEDQAWAKRIIEAGYAKAYAPTAAVYHSHNYSVWATFRRSYDESRALHGLFGYRLCPTVPHGLRAFVHMTAADCHYTLRRGKIFRELFWMLRSGWANGARLSGHFLGALDAHISPALRDVLSLDRANKSGKTTLQGLSALAANLTSRRSSRKRDILAPFRFLNAPMIDPNRAPGPKDNRTINWVIPDFGIGAGGHTNIFRLIQMLEQAGFLCRIYIVGRTSRTSGEGARNAIREHFSPIEAEVFIGDAFAPARFTIATSWETVYSVIRFTGTDMRCYFVQDFEPFFFAPGSHYYLAENTYRQGLVGITAGTWLAEKLRAEFGMRTYAMGFSFDRSHYFSKPARTAGRKRVFFYARPITERRAFELGILALERLHRLMPGVEFVLAGWDLADYALPFPHTSLGVASQKQLGEVFNTCDAALVISATNLSLMPLELMACDCAVVSNRGANVEWLLTPDISVLTEASVEGLSDGLRDILSDDVGRQALTARARAFAEATEWRVEADKVVGALTQLSQEIDQAKAASKEG